MGDSPVAASSIPQHGYWFVRCYSRPVVRLRSRVPRDPARITALMTIFDELCSGGRPWPLFIHGDPGVGKSVATYCMADMVTDYAWYDLDRICDALVSRSEEWQRISRHDKVTILDEIGGRDVVSSVDADAVKKFLDLRENLANRIGIYVSNHGPDAIRDLYGKRIASRLLCGTVFHMQGVDQRLAAR